ncbi:MAG: hypothetical protein RR404_04130, partial [Bacilli bacterium]
KNKHETIFNITINNIKFNFELIDKTNIETIKYYSDNEYQCILPLFKNKKLYTDILCQKNDIQYWYNSISNPSSKLTEFRNNYKLEKLLDDKSKTKKINLITIYQNNLLENKYIILNNYKGINIINKNSVKTIELFTNDVYEQTIKGKLGAYYVIADYNKKYEFSDFYVVNILTGKKEIIKTNYKISFDTIVQGEYDNSLYIYDKENKKQYQIKKDRVFLNSSLKVYQNGEFKTINNTANLYFDKQIKYQIKKDKIFLNKTYLFTTNNQIKYDKDYICVIDKQELKCYNQLTGLKTVLENSEFEFNKTLSYDLYVK